MTRADAAMYILFAVGVWGFAAGTACLARAWWARTEASRRHRAQARQIGARR